VDEAQLSYTDRVIWKFVKYQASATRTQNLRAVLFSSLGSASSEFLNIAGSAPVVFAEAQKVELTKQPGWPHNFALRFDIARIRKRMLQKSGSKLDNDII
jgi:hypothetical protein